MRQQMTDACAEQLALENKLRRALERDEFVLHYQPKIDIATRRIVGVEALIRWQKPGAGLVPPCKFMPLLEETGLILRGRRLGADARRGATTAAGWSAACKPPRVAVNVSAIQLRQRELRRHRRARGPRTGSRRRRSTSRSPRA